MNEPDLTQITNEIWGRAQCYFPDEPEFRAAIAALPAVLPVVTVKPLVWKDFEGQGAKAQAWKQANYLITWWKSRGQFEVVASYPGYQGEAIGAGFYSTIEAAKAAAQADYAARILAALDVQPAPSGRDRRHGRTYGGIGN